MTGTSASFPCIHGQDKLGPDMLDWLTWPADQLLWIGGVVAG